MNGKLIRFIDAYLGIPLIRLVSFLFLTRHFRSSQFANVSPRKILLLKFWGIGNIFMLLPTIQALRKTYPNAAVDFLTLEHNRDALAMTGAVDEIATINIRSLRLFLATWLSAAARLRRKRYDLIIDCEQFARFSALLTYQIHAARSIGFDTRGQHRHHLYSDPIVYQDDIHVTRSFYALAQKGGVSEPFSPRIDLIDEAVLDTKGNSILKEYAVSASSPIMVMHVGSSDNFKERRWPTSSYARLADLLIDRFDNPILMTGLSDEAFLIAETKFQMRHPDRVIDLSAQLTFADYCALIAAADLVVSADTATVHIASSVNTPVVGLYGPNTPRLYGPWGIGGSALYSDFDCSPCITNFNEKINTCRHPQGRGACMNAISVEMAFEAIEALYLQGTAARPLKHQRKAAP